MWAIHFMRLFSGCINISIYAWQLVSVFIYSCLPQEKHRANCVCMNGNKQVYSWMQTTLQQQKQLPQPRWRVSIHEFTEEPSPLSLCVSLPTGSHHTHIRTHTLNLWTEIHLAVIRGHLTNQSCNLGVTWFEAAPDSVTFSKFIMNLWIYSGYTYAHTNLCTAHNSHCISTPFTTHLVCVFALVGGKVCVVRSPLMLSSAPPRPSCQSLNLEKCQWAQWAGRAGRCVTVPQTDTNTSAALVISKHLKESRRPEREARESQKHKRDKRWGEEPGCQIGKHLSSISVTTARLTASVAMATGDRQASWREGWSKKSAAVTYFRRERNWATVCQCVCVSVWLLYNFTSWLRC